MAEDQPLIFDETCVCYGADAIRMQLVAMHSEKDGVRLAEDHEYLHRMRVASRRARRALDVFGACAGDRSSTTLKLVKRLTQTLGPARDTDVQLEFVASCVEGTEQKPASLSGLRRLALRLEQRRKNQQKEIIKLLDRFERSGIWQNMLRPFDELRARCVFSDNHDLSVVKKYAGLRIAERLTAMLAYEQYVDYETASEELHEMRIAAKFLRYEMELFDPGVNGVFKPYISAVKKIQDLLGLIHDCDIWLEFLPEFIAEEEAYTLAFFGHKRGFKRVRSGLEALAEGRREVRRSTYHEFVSYWEELQLKKLWKGLHELASEYSQ